MPAKQFILSLITAIATAIPVCLKAQNPPFAEKIEAVHLQNLHRVDAQLYRSEQPRKAGMKALEDYGINSIVNLRRTRKDNHKARKTSLELHHVRINSWTIDYENLVEALKAINRAEKPVLIHCMHGSDRAGAVTAAYRIAFNGWSKEQALEELRFGGFGFHKTWFPNIISLIESIDELQLRMDVGLNKMPVANIQPTH